MSHFAGFWRSDPVELLPVTLRAKNPGMKPFRSMTSANHLPTTSCSKGAACTLCKRCWGLKQISMTVDLYGNLKAADVGTVSPYQF